MNDLPNSPDLSPPLAPPSALRRPSAGQVALVGLFALAILYTLYFAQAVLLPVMLAILLSLPLGPVVKGLARINLNEGVAAALVVAALLGATVFVTYSLADPAADWLRRGPVVASELEFKLGAIRDSIEQAREASRRIEDIAEPAPTAAPEVVVRGPSLAQQVLSQTQYVVANLVIVTVLLFFFLAQGRTMVDRTIAALPNAALQHHYATIVDTVQRQVAIYLATITAINAGLGVTTALTMWALGMPNPALWGVVAGVLNFIPYLGAVATTIILALVSLLTFEQPLHIVLPPLAFIALTTAEGYFITPTVVGRRLTLNPIAVFVAVLFWGWLWGIAGALLAVPILAVGKIICDHTRILRPIGALLGR